MEHQESETVFFISSADTSIPIYGPYLSLEGALDIISYMIDWYIDSQSLFPIKIEECTFDGFYIKTKMEFKNNDIF